MAETVIVCTHEGAEHVWQPGEGCPDAIPAGTWAVRPAPVAAEGTDELREALASSLIENFFWGIAWGKQHEAADRLLAGPLAPLLAKLQAVEAAVQRVRELADRLDREGVVHLFHGPHNRHQWTTEQIRRALDGESRG